ncbi:MAG: diaminopimelate decarboxylase [Clostridia bacterium]|nr:diaminopimelate decarboxylase [Clostridia bacterium]
MELREGLVIGAQNHLFIGGCDAEALAREFGTPLYVIDETYLRSACKAFVGAMNAYAPGGVIRYASKAFCSMAMCRIAYQEGMGLDVVSGGELYTAYKAGFPMDRVALHGNCKTPHELTMAIDLGVSDIVVDSRDEIALIDGIAGSLAKRVNVQLRVNPDIDVHTHPSIHTSGQDSKFGLGIDNGEALSAIKAILACRNLRLTGVHTHLGSQIFSMDPYRKAVDRLTDFMVLSAAVAGAQMSELTVGGGFGVRYTQDDPESMCPEDAVRTIAQEVKRQAGRKGLSLPRLILEPGRAIVAEAGVMLYTVSGVKRIPGVCGFAIVDGGMMDNPRPLLYDARYRALLANRCRDRPNERLRIVGRACEDGDTLGEYLLPSPEQGDILAMLTAGAYQYSMASRYNRVPVPAVVLTRFGKAEPIVERERYDDIIRMDRIPNWL